MAKLGQAEYPYEHFEALVANMRAYEAAEKLAEEVKAAGKGKDVEEAESNQSALEPRNRSSQQADSKLLENTVPQFGSSAADVQHSNSSLLRRLRDSPGLSGRQREASQFAQFQAQQDFQSKQPNYFQ